MANPRNGHEIKVPVMTAPLAKKHPVIDKILIVGPNGNVGRHLIPKLLELGYQVRALQYRSTVKARPGLETFGGNTLDTDSSWRKSSEFIARA